ncbi:P-loop containing nucleoside triphosphate hydrolase protein [Lentinula raphanica]|nr:P-loop containing nucleoside triphosphate hydrolase protein [Lentinula raphanica]
MTQDISDTVYSTRSKALLGLVTQLTALGAQNDLDLPRITVIGNQSAGKSSVVEAISGITVPRDPGTCTRCPMECRLHSSSQGWSCRISIRYEYGHDGRRLREVTEKVFIGKIINKSQVELALRRAQFAVLNPDVPFEKVLAASAAELKGMTSPKSMPFSQNVVCVDLEGPDLTDLSFIDLPGLIQNAEPKVVQLVEDMVISHIKGDCIILVAIPMTDDIENQKALRLASQADRDGRRTIGVLTKPDMLGTGSTKAAQLWLDVIDGRRHPLVLGYYCTLQPNDDQRSAGIEHSTAREGETKFFETTAPWCQSTNPSNFGTHNLVSTLSKLLVQVIDRRLPGIREDASKQLSECREALTRVAPPISEEPATYMLSLITSFCADFQTLVRGNAESAELIRQHRQTFRKFKFAIRKTAPSFVPFESSHPMTNFYNCLDDEENDPVAKVSALAKSAMNLTQVRRHIDQSLTRELPNNVPYESKASLIVRFQTTWPEAVDECFEAVEAATLKVLQDMIERYFGRFNLLQSHIRTLITTLMDEHKEKCQTMLNATLATERMPYTQNDHYLESTTQGWLDKYRAIRSGNLVEDCPDPQTKNDSDSTSASFSGFDPNPNTTGGRTSDSSGQTPFSFAGLHTPLESPLSSSSSTSSTSNRSSSTFTFAPSTRPSQTLPFPFGAPPPSNGSTSSSWTQPSPVSANTAKPSSNAAHVKKPSTTSAETKTTEQIDDKALLEAISLLVKAGVPIASLSPTEIVGKLAPSDEFEKELKVMAEVRGYFQVAYKRMIDNIPRFIDLLFVRELGKTLQPFLISKFSLGTSSANERCEKYLGEDPHTVAKREELLARRKRLESVRRELDEYSLRV